MIKAVSTGVFLKYKNKGKASAFFTVCLTLLLFSFIPLSSYAEEANTPTIAQASAESSEMGPEELEAYIVNHLREPSIDESILKLGRLYLKKKEFSKAADAYKNLLLNFPESRFRSDALYESGYAKYKAGRLNEAKIDLANVAGNTFTKAAVKAKAEALLKEIDSPSFTNFSPDIPAIGVILPFKGNYAQFGDDALNGILLAAQVFGGKDKTVNVIVKNVGPDPASAEAAVAELSNDPRVAGLIGPLLSSAAEDTVRAAQKNRVPIITLSQKEGITEAGEYVFRDFLTPRSQTAAVADYASRTLGKKRFAVLHPKSNYGVELARSFEKEVKRLGGEIVKTASYEQGTTDFSDEMKRLFNVQVKERKEGRRKIKEYKPTARIDALFIPDNYESVALIAPYLDYYNIKDVQLLGTNGWNSAKLVQTAGKNIEGAIFVDGFFPSSARAGADEFTRKFREAYGKEPGVLEAQAYDAAMILITAINESREQGRDSIRDRLKSIKDFKGATGTQYFDSEREAVKRLFILTVVDGNITEAKGY